MLKNFCKLCVSSLLLLVSVDNLSAQSTTSFSTRNENITQRAEAKKAKKKNKNKGGNKDKENKDTSLKAVCSKGIRKIGGGILYKPAADSSDSRRGKPVVLLQGSNKTGTSSLKVYDSGGKTICTLAFKAPDVAGTNGGSDHYWSGWRGGCGKTGSQLATLAKPSGSTSIYIQSKSRQCLGPVNPTARTGNIF